MVVLAVDPGEKNIGIAVSDPTGSLARPLTVVRHVVRQMDAAVIAQLAAEQRARLIIVGQALDDDGEPTPEGRKAARLAEAIRGQTEIPVMMWDESGSTGAARAIHIQSGGSRRRRRGHMDDAAAAVILQTYLDAQNPPDLVPPDCIP
jgi:putative holliday junction resolvase